MSTSLREHIVAEHARQLPQLPGQGDSWLTKTRQEALDRFTESGLPTPHQENWKYTDLRALEKQRPQASNQLTLAVDQIARYFPEQMHGHRMVFVNGYHAPELSGVGTLPTGATLLPLSQKLTTPDEALRARFNASVNGHGNALTDLNTAFVRDGVFLQLEDGIALDRPLHLLFLSTGGGMTHLRNLIQLGRNSEAVLVEHYVGLDESLALTNVVTEARTEDGARLSRCKLQQESASTYHFGAFFLDQAANSQARLFGIDLGGQLVRNDTNSRLDGTGAEVHLHGVYAPSEKQHMDNHTRIDHLHPHGTSREIYKGVLGGQGRGVFNGKIVVHKDAQKTDSSQSSAALLLSKTARVDSKPELEIYADDVKCAHGATVGQLDETAVFYLQSRGVDEASARNILTYSFADEVIRQVGNEALRKHIEAHFIAKLPNGQLLRELL